MQHRHIAETNDPLGALFKFWKIDSVNDAANAIAAVANMGMGALYIPGSEESIGDMKTRAKKEIFTDKEGVKEVAIKFNQAANELAKVAATGDKIVIAQAFKDTGASCKACHDKYRKD